MTLKTLLLTNAVALLLTAAASAQGSIFAGPVQLFHPFAARDNAAATFNTDFAQTGSANCSVQSPLPFALKSVGPAANGTVTLLPDHSLVYLPGRSFSGQDSFAYTVTDSIGASSTGVVTVADFAAASGSYVLDFASYYFFNGGIMTLSAGGAFTLRGQAYDLLPTSFAGSLNQYGSFGNPNPNPAGGEQRGVKLSLQDGAPTVAGGIVGAYDVVNSFTGVKITPAGTKAGLYSALFFPYPDTSPAGIGWATMSVTPRGLISLAGQDGNGSALSANSAVRPDGSFYVHTLQNHGALGRATFQDIPGASDFAGFWDGGIVGSLLGSRFTPAAPGGRLLGFSRPNGTAQLVFQDGDLLSLLSARATIGPGDTVSAITSPLRQLSFSAADRTAHGSAVFGASGGQFSGVFSELTPGPPQTWQQGGASGFGQDAQNNVSTQLPIPDTGFAGPSPAGVVLATLPGASGALVAGPITNPGFEAPLSSGWTVATSGSNATVTELGTGNDPVFPTEGSQFVRLSVPSGGWASLSQTVDLTGVDFLYFDAQILGESTFTSSFDCIVYIDGHIVWRSSLGSLGGTGDLLNQEALVNYGGGAHVLQFYLSAVNQRGHATFDLDNLRTYGPYGFQSSGSLVSTPIAPPAFDQWGAMTYNAMTYFFDALTVDVLDVDGSLLAANLPSGVNLSNIPAVALHTAIRLRANLSTSSSGETPELLGWSVSWQPAPPLPKPRSFRGVVFQKQNIAVGLFVEHDGNTGSVVLTPE